MSGSRKSTLRAQASQWGILAQAAVVAGVMLFALLAIAPVAFALSGNAGAVAAAVAAGLCLLGALGALIATVPFSRPSAAMYSVTVGMLARALIPLIFGAVLHLKVPVLANAGMIFYLLVFYMAALATETVLMLARIPTATASSGKAG